jgi:hypothetical protein
MRQPNHLMRKLKHLEVNLEVSDPRSFFYID